MKRMEKTESRLVHFISVCCFVAAAVVVVAVHRFKWPQFEHNHILITYLHSFLLSVSLSFFIHFHTHSVAHSPIFKTCSYAVSSRPICIHVHVSRKRCFKHGKNEANTKENKSERHRERQETVLETWFVFWQICYRSDFRGMSTYYRSTYMWENAFIFEQQ